MAVTFEETLINNLQTNGNEDDLIDDTFEGKHDEILENANNSQNEFFYDDNEQKEIEENDSRISVEDIEEEAQEDFNLEIGEDNLQFQKLNPILSEDLLQLTEISEKSYSHSYILDDIEDEYEEEKEEDWEKSYKEEEVEEDEDEISYYKESDEGSKEKISLEAETSGKTLTIEERMNLIKLIRSALNERKLLKSKNSYLHQNCCAILIAYKRMDTVDKGLDQAMVHNDLRYKVALEEYSKVKFKIDSRMNILAISTQDLENELLSLETAFNIISEELTSLEFEKGLGLKISGTGRRLSEDDTEKLIEKQKQRSLEMTQVRITFIQYQNMLKNINNKLHKLEFLGLDLTTKYYRKLLRHKQLVMDRIEDQRQNIRKFQKKYFTSPTILHYIKQCSGCIESSIVEEKSKCEESIKIKERIQSEVVALGRKRTILRTRNYKLHDSLRILNNPNVMKQLAVTKAEFLKKKKIESDSIEAEMNLIQ